MPEGTQLTETLSGSARITQAQTLAMVLARKATWLTLGIRTPQQEAEDLVSEWEQETESRPSWFTDAWRDWLVTNVCARIKFWRIIKGEQARMG